MLMSFLHTSSNLRTVQRPPGRDPSFAGSCWPAKSIRWLSAVQSLDASSCESCLKDHRLTDPWKDWKVAIHKYKSRCFIFPYDFHQFP